MRPLLSLAPPLLHTNFYISKAGVCFIWFLHITWARRSSVHTSSIHRFPLQNCNRGLTGNRSAIKDSCFYNALGKASLDLWHSSLRFFKMHFTFKIYPLLSLLAFCKGISKMKKMESLIQWESEVSLTSPGHKNQQDSWNTWGTQGSSINHTESTRTV